MLRYVHNIQRELSMVIALTAIAIIDHLSIGTQNKKYNIRTLVFLPLFHIHVLAHTNIYYLLCIQSPKNFLRSSSLMFTRKTFYKIYTYINVLLVQNQQFQRKRLSQPTSIPNISSSSVVLIYLSTGSFSAIEIDITSLYRFQILYPMIS